MDMNCQQTCEISHKKTYNRSENIPKSFRGGYSLETPCMFTEITFFTRHT